MSDPFIAWFRGCMAGVAAPANRITLDLSWAWARTESGPVVMRWNNPLNTTEPWPGAKDMNSVGVKAYLSVEDGIGATCATLLNGLYPVILANLRGSVPRAQWGNACANLGKWGTRCAWLATDYGPPPDLGEAEMILLQPTGTQAIYAVDAAGKRLISAAEWAVYGSPPLSLVFHPISPADLAAIPDVPAATPAHPAQAVSGTFTGKVL